MWGWVPAVAISIGVVGSFLIDPMVLLLWPGTKRLHVAHAFRTIQSTPNTYSAIQVSWFGGRAGVVWRVNFTPESPANYFESLPDIQPLGIWLEIVDLQPHIKTASLNQPGRIARVHGGKMRPQQFVDLMEGSAGFARFSDIEVVDGPNEKQITSAAKTYFSSLPRGATAKMLSTFARDAQVPQLNFYNNEFSDDDWDAIFKTAETIPVKVAIHDLSEAVLNRSKNLRPKNLEITCFEYDLREPVWWNLLPGNLNQRNHRLFLTSLPYLPITNYLLSKSMAPIFAA